MNEIKFKVGDIVEVIETSAHFEKGDILTVDEWDDCPYCIPKSGNRRQCIYQERLKLYSPFKAVIHSRYEKKK